MTKLQSFFAHLAAAVAVVGPYLLVAQSLPGPVGHYTGLVVQALVGVGLLRITLPATTASKSSQAGFARLRLLALLSMCAIAFCVACAAFRSATAADAEAEVQAITGDLLKACDSPALADSKKKVVRYTCLAVRTAQQVETTVESPPPAPSASPAVPAGGSGAQ